MDETTTNYTDNIFSEFIIRLNDKTNLDNIMYEIFSGAMIEPEIDLSINEIKLTIPGDATHDAELLIKRYNDVIDTASVEVLGMEYAVPNSLKTIKHIILK